MNIWSKINSIKEKLTKERDYPLIDNSLAWTTFLISLTGTDVAWISSIVHKFISDKKTKDEISKVYESVSHCIDKSDSIEASVQSIAKNLENDKNNNSIIERLITNISKQSKLKVETNKHSYQEILDSIINYDSVDIKTENNSKTLISWTTINANETTLSATNGSQNLISNTSFNWLDWQVRMEWIHSQIWNISVKWSSIGYLGNNSHINMWWFAMWTDDNGNFFLWSRNTNITVTCPRCNSSYDMDESQIIWKSKMKCLRCWIESNI